jgi:hypothetical protein
MIEFWNERYSAEEYAYGELPNKFVVKELSKLKPGKILFPAEGEGRNAVYASAQGWEVTAFDPSTEGKKKAKLLAAKHNVCIDYQIMDYENFDFTGNYFDCIVLVFAHMPSSIRKRIHTKLCTYLKPEGTLILEGFSKEQINRSTGGPRNLDFLFTEKELKSDFSNFSELKINEVTATLNEGPFHNGQASLIRVVGKK